MTKCVTARPSARPRSQLCPTSAWITTSSRMLIRVPALPAARDKSVFPDECSQSTLVLPSSAPNDGALVCLRVTNDWTKILLDLSAVLQDERLWVEGTDLDTAYVFAQQLEQIIVRAVEDCNMAVIPIGTISMFAATAPPEKWLVCEGQAISRETYAELFAVIGEAYGSGDFSTTFNVPNFIDRSPMGTGGDFTGFPGATSGAHEITLTEF